MREGTDTNNNLVKLCKEGMLEGYFAEGSQRC